MWWVWVWVWALVFWLKLLPGSLALFIYPLLINWFLSRVFTRSFLSLWPSFAHRPPLGLLAHLCLVLAGPAHRLSSSVPDHQINAWNFDTSACPFLGPLTTLWIEFVITLQIVQNATARKANITPVFNDTSLAARCLRRKCKILLLKVVMAAEYKVELVSSHQLQILRRENANQPQTQKVFAVLSCMPCFNWYTHYCNHLFLECNLF